MAGVKPLANTKSILEIQDRLKGFDDLDLNDRLEVLEKYGIYTSLSDLKNATAGNFPYYLLSADGKIEYTYQVGDFRNNNDEINVVTLSGVPASIGALVRSGCSTVNFDGRSLFSKVVETVSVKDARFAGGAKGDGVTIDTAAFKACRDECQMQGKQMLIPAGHYIVDDSIVIQKSFNVRGEGTERTIIDMVSSVSKPVFDISPSSNSMILGIKFGNLQIRCSGGSAVCDGIVLRTDPTNSTVRQCEFSNIWIRDTRRGFSMSGVVYRNFITNITVQGVSDIGFYSDAGFIDVVYNTFAQLEVTNVANGAWAYYLRTNFSLFDMLTSDGVAYFSSPGGILRNYKLETIQATSYPSFAGNFCVVINQMQLIDSPTCIGVDPAKRSTFMRIIGTNTSIRGARFVPPHPINPFYLEPGSSGVIDCCSMSDGPHNKIEDTHPNSIMNNWVFMGCFDITSRSLRFQRDTWTPTFSAEWTTVPTSTYGEYRCDGNRVMYVVTGVGGECTIGAKITSVPLLHKTAGVGRLVSPSQDSPCVMVAGTTDPTSSNFVFYKAMSIPQNETWTIIMEAGQ